MKKKERKQKQEIAIRKIRSRIKAQFSLQPVFVILAAASALMLMTWLIRDVLDVQHIYAAAGFELLGIAVVLLSFLIPFNIVLYRRRVREVSTLSEAIQRVARGDFASRIPTDKKTQITPIYEDFNLMCAELESVQILRNDFLNNFSHEFKTPIASINGFAQLLQEKKGMPEEERMQYLEIIAEESARLSAFSTNTSLLSKLSAQSIITGQEKYNLAEQLRQCTILLSPKWMKKNLEVTGDLAPVMFSGNKEMMQHMWINLLDNAVKYTPEGGEIKVSCVKEDDSAKITIADTGIGIAEDDLKHLFDPYYQVETSHSGQGLGLGLAIVMRIIELVKADISVKSRENQGTTFEIHLPLE